MSIDQLISGYKSFRQDYYLERPEFYKNLVKNGQSPETMIIACSENEVKREFIDSWVSIAEKALDTNLEGDDQYRYVERRAIEISLENLLTFPWLKKKCEAGDLELHGCLFDLESGKLFTRGVDNDWTTIT